MGQEVFRECWRRGLPRRQFPLLPGRAELIEQMSQQMGEGEHDPKEQSERREFRV